ncbi:hypothetical protein GM415_10825 [Pseudodesulfovibrio cashew]|uniref:Uncharacterized protein n=1 Tax=Pseudodesulfovibrio cashew TaxID=2678688 RepID=A0A6I6JSN7_9BACT|nr:hypothetical protein [Pseudodesulfovibrio cashew]QGY40594.1 hypothetical protein GM415_10825 [Pseudodesulfovibrio cashew]
MLPKLDIKEKNFHAMILVGGFAGVLEGSLRQGLTLHTMFPGMMLTLVAAFTGGFTGFFFKDLFRTWRGMPPYRGVNNDGWTMGAFLGSVLGVLWQIANSDNGANLVIGSMTGSFLGAMFGAFPDEFVTPILELMRAREAAKQTGEEERAAQPHS